MENDASYHAQPPAPVLYGAPDYSPIGADSFSPYGSQRGGTGWPADELERHAWSVPIGYQPHPARAAFAGRPSQPTGAEVVGTCNPSAATTTDPAAPPITAAFTGARGRLDRTCSRWAGKYVGEWRSASKQDTVYGAVHMLVERDGCTARGAIEYEGKYMYGLRRVLRFAVLQQGNMDPRMPGPVAAERPLVVFRHAGRSLLLEFRATSVGADGSMSGTYYASAPEDRGTWRAWPQNFSESYEFHNRTPVGAAVAGAVHSVLGLFH